MKCPECKKIMVDCYQKWVKKNGQFEYMHCGIYFCKTHGYFKAFNGYVTKHQAKLARIEINHDKEWNMERLID